MPDRDDVEIEARPGWTVMEALRDAGLPIAARCGGGCACASCHVHIDPAFFGRLAEISEDETDLLESSEYYEPSASRLSCHSPTTLRSSRSTTRQGVSSAKP